MQSFVVLILLSLMIFDEVNATPSKTSLLQHPSRHHHTSLPWKNVDLVITDLHTGTMEVGQTKPLFTLHLKSPIVEPVTFILRSKREKIANPLQCFITFTSSNSTIPTTIYVHGDEVGDTDILVEYMNTDLDSPRNESECVHVHIIRSLQLKTLSIVVGWIYFLAWGISPYPQVYTNFKRKSVVGLNLDYLSYNVTGFIAYTIFSLSLYFIPAVQVEYFAKYGGSVMPVRVNDLVFVCHNTLINSLTGLQCFIYERGNQRLSKVARVLLTLMWLFPALSIIPTILKKIHWLTYLNFFSYVKLFATVIKYVPQAYMNFVRKSTVGWSIWGILLDATGGTLSLLQMLLIAYNNNEWNSIFGDLVKIGLAVLTLIFDSVFIIQHYLLYREPTSVKNLSTPETEKDITS